MRKIWASLCTVGALTKAEFEQFADWVWRKRSLNRFDPEVMGYPRTTVLKAEDHDGTLMYVPVHPVLMCESIAARPDLWRGKQALALKAIDELIHESAVATNHAESFFLCADPELVEICQNHGYEVLEGFTIVRKKHIQSQDRKETGDEVTDANSV